MRQTVGTSGQLEFELRDPSGSLVSRFVQRSADSYPTLDRDYVYGLGRQLLERKVTAIAPVGSVIHPLSGSGVYNLSVSSGAGSYAIDLSTPSGWTNYLPVVTADTSGNITIAESELKPGEVNFVRIRKDGTNETGYSAPLALIYDPSVTSSTPNQVRALGVSRSGTNVTIRWSLLTQNNKPLRLYFRRADGTATYLLTPSNLPSTTTNLTLDSQSLAAPCGSFFLTQVLTGGESGESAKADLPNPQAGLGGRQPCGSTGGGPGGSGLTSNYSWLNYSMHRDHLSSLRVVTDDAGRRLEGLDYYAYGLEMPLSGALGWRSRAKYTVHDRDEGAGSTGNDYMLMREKGVRYPFFLSEDLIDDVDTTAPLSWSRHSYVRHNAINFLDPDGLATRPVNCNEWPDPEYCVSVSVYGTWSGPGIAPDGTSEAWRVLHGPASIPGRIIRVWETPTMICVLSWTENDRYHTTCWNKPDPLAATPESATPTDGSGPGPDDPCGILECTASCIAELYGIETAAGLALHGLGQPAIPKERPPLNDLSPGTSWLSKTGRELAPQVMPRHVWTPTATNWYAKSRVLGTIAGRWASTAAVGVGWFLVLHDAARAGACSGKCTARSEGRSCRGSRINSN